jgi:hypothetical protein
MVAAVAVAAASTVVEVVAAFMEAAGAAVSMVEVEAAASMEVASAAAEDIPATARREALAAAGAPELTCRAAGSTAADSEAAPRRMVFVPVRQQGAE